MSGNFFGALPKGKDIYIREEQSPEAGLGKSEAI